MLTARNISKHFSGVKALDNVCMDLLPGKVNAVIGENGAGKSTLMKILSGVYNEFEGEIILNEKQVRFKDTREARDAGIAIIHQELTLIPYLSILENIFLGREMTNSWGFLDKASMRTKTEAILKRLGMEEDPDTSVASLRVGQQQVVEIARALCFDADVIIMDEPTSAISESEVEILFRVIDGLKKENKTIVYISHKLDELVKIADCYIVLRDGKSIESGEMKNVQSDDIVVKMIGRNITAPEKRKWAPEHVVMKVNHVSLRHPYVKSQDVLNNISFTVHRGEILGVFGLMGAGRTELLEAIFGLHPNRVTGNVVIDDVHHQLKSVDEAIRAGLALVPEDRKKDGLAVDLGVRSNLSITTLKDLSNFGILDNSRENLQCDKYVNDLGIKVTSREMLVKYLSGGNQQKIVIAKWLATKPKVLLLDEPTRGIDVNAKNEIYKLIRQLADNGLAVVFVSSELPELMTTTDRIIVMCEGKLTADLVAATATERNILNAAIPRQTSS